MRLAGARALLATFLLLGGAPALAQPAAPNEAARAQARALAREAAAAYESGDYAAALAKFQDAYRTFASPLLLFNLGQAFKQLARPVEATESFERFLVEAGDAPADAREEATRSLEALRDQVAHIEVVSDVAGAEVLIDGKSLGTTPLPRPTLVGVGPHQVVVQKAGAATFLRRIQAVGGSTLKLEAHLGVPEPRPRALIAEAVPSAVPSAGPPPIEVGAPAPGREPTPPAWARRVGVGLLIAAPVLGASGLVLGKFAQDEGEKIADLCVQKCEGASIVDRDRRGRRYEAAQWVLLGTGAAALVGGAVLLVIDGTGREASPRVSLAPTADGGAAALIAGRW